MIGNGPGGGGGAVQSPIRLVTASAFVASDMLRSNDGTVEVNAFLQSGNFPEILPGAAACTGRQYTVKKVDSSANAIVLSDASGVEIEGNASYSLAQQNQFVTLQSDGAQWIVIGSNGTSTPSGTAGGSLSGTYPNPGLAAGAAATNVGTLGGDLTGTLPNPTVNRIGGLGRVQVVGQSAVASSVTGTTSKTILGSVSIPANTLGVNGALRITALWSVTNNADSKTLGMQIGSTAIQSTSAASQAALQSLIILRNRNSQQSQVSMNSNVTSGLGLLGAANATYTLDFSQAQTLQFFATLGTSTDTATLEGYSVEALNP